MELPGEVLTILVLVALGLAALAIFLLISATPKGGRKLADSHQAVALLSKHEDAIVKLQAALRRVAEDQREQAEALLTTVQRIGLVRYDAFEDMGGHLSFSAALLDSGGSGLVITSINSRQDTRCYAKVVRAGASVHNLSAEEEEAIGRAMEPPEVPLPEEVAVVPTGRSRGRQLRSP